MKFRLLLLLLSIFISFHAFSDTLSVYDASSVNTLYYKSTTYSKQAARFDLPKPATLKSLIFNVDGVKGETFKVRLVGHEGGVILPSLFSDIMDPITVTKPNEGFEKVDVPITENVYLANNQFFIIFEDVSTDLKILSDRLDHEIACQSGSGGTYYYQYLFRESDQTWYLAGSTNRAFAIDVILEYDEEKPPVFVDKTTDAGINTSLSNSSIAVADYNNDGNQDLLISGKLYEFQSAGKFKDVTTAKGIINKYSGVTANAFIDMDNDGDLDIILFGGDSSILFVNDGGSFTEHGLNIPKLPSMLSFSFADINHDKYPDLFISQLWGAYPVPMPNYFFYNDQNLNFTDETKRIYPNHSGAFNYSGNTACDENNNTTWIPNGNKNKRSRGSEFFDFDNDGDLDLYIVNYFLEKDEFYRNNGDGTFTDIIASKGIDECNTGSNHGTGVDWYDYDNDGDMDLLLPQFAHPNFVKDYDHRGTAIYRNEGAPSYNFKDMVGQYADYKGLKSDIGLELEETHAGGAWGDVNNDGLADFLMTVFYGCRYIDFYEQQIDHTFELKTYKYGLEGINTGNDLVWLDYDADGRLDLAGAESGKFKLFKNDVWNGRSFIELDLRSVTANSYAIGARATVYANGQQYMQEVTAGRGQKMQKPYRLHFGLDKAQDIDSVVVLWPTKPQIREVFTGLSINNIYELKEGQGATVSVENSSQKIDVKVYPNPSQGNIAIILNGEANQNCQVEIFDLIGQKIATPIQFITSKNQKSYYWKADDNLANGIYHVKISIGNQIYTERIILNR